MKKLIFILSILFISLACKKEKKIERNLWKNGGEWEIMKYEEIMTSTESENEKNEVIENAGIFQFEKNGYGFIINKKEYFAQKVNFKYEINDSELTLDYFMNGFERKLEIDWSKNAFILTQNLTDYYFDGNVNAQIKNTITYRYTCKKN